MTSRTAPIVRTPSGVDAPYINLGPLTSEFVATFSCTETTTLDGQGNLRIYDLYSQTTWPCNPPPAGPLPPSWDLVESSATLYYSPGICPQAWTTAKTLQYTGLPDTVAFLCCPKSFTPYSAFFDGSSFCASDLPSGAVLTNLCTIVFTSTRLGNDAPQITITAPVDRSTVTKAGLVLTVAAVVVMPETPATLAPSTSGITSTADGMSSSQSSRAHQTTKTSSESAKISGKPESVSSHLSPGAKAGIAVGVITLFVLVILSVVFVFWKRRSSKCSQIAAHELISPANTHEMITAANAHELDVPKRAEKHAEVSELDAGYSMTATHNSAVDQSVLSPVVELHGSHTKPTLQSDTTDTQTWDDDRQNVDHAAVNTSTNQPPPPLVDFQSALTTPVEGLPPGRSPVSSEVAARAHDVSNIPIAAETIDGNVEAEKEKKMKILRDRMSAIQEEKERLERIHQLKFLEEETRQEIARTENSSGS